MTFGYLMRQLVVVNRCKSRTSLVNCTFARMLSKSIASDMMLSLLSPYAGRYHALASDIVAVQRRNIR